MFIWCGDGNKNRCVSVTHECMGILLLINNVRKKEKRER